MKYDKKDRTKVIVLAAVLAALWIIIIIRFGVLSRRTKAKLEAHEATHAAQTAGAPTTRPGGRPSPVLRLGALVKPVDPPRNDPFRPVIPPRSHASAPAASRPAQEPEAPPSLPPLFGAETPRVSDRLTLTGVIMGNPSMAILRLGDDRWVVRVGDLLDGRFRVQEIRANTVVLRDGRSTYTLRLGG